MAMTEAQVNAFNAAANATVADSHLLFVGSMVAILFLWSAWSLFTSYKGWAGGSTSGKVAAGAFFRVIALILVGIYFVASK